MAGRYVCGASFVNAVRTKLAIVQSVFVPRYRNVHKVASVVNYFDVWIDAQPFNDFSRFAIVANKCEGRVNFTR